MVKFDEPIFRLKLIDSRIKLKNFLKSRNWNKTSIDFFFKELYDSKKHLNGYVIDSDYIYQIRGKTTKQKIKMLETIKNKKVIVFDIEGFKVQGKPVAYIIASELADM